MALRSSRSGLLNCDEPSFLPGGFLRRQCVFVLIPLDWSNPASASRRVNGREPALSLPTAVDRCLRLQYSQIEGTSSSSAGKGGIPRACNASRARARNPHDARERSNVWAFAIKNWQGRAGHSLPSIAREECDRGGGGRAAVFARGRALCGHDLVRVLLFTGTFTCARESRFGGHGPLLGRL